MAKWCDKCERNPYTGCDDSCPIFGKTFSELAAAYFKLKERCEGWKRNALELDAGLREYQRMEENHLTFSSMEDVLDG